MGRNQVTLILAGMLVASSLLAQPPGRGAARAGNYYQRMGEYLELSDSQELEWQQILDSGKRESSGRFEKVQIMRDEFSRLAASNQPDLTTLGQLALDIHRTIQEIQAARLDSEEALRAVLTPEQIERFDLYKEARSSMRPNERHSRKRWHNQSPDDDTN